MREDESNQGPVAESGDGEGRRSDHVKKSSADDRHGKKANSEEKPELFDKEKQFQQKPWWEFPHQVDQPVLVGAWDGVFVSCLLHLIGVIMFLRSGWLVGHEGIWMAASIISFSVIVVFTTVLASIGICQRLSFHLGGGIHALLSSVLGAKNGAALAIAYSFAQAAGCALHASGFGEAISNLSGWRRKDSTVDHYSRNITDSIPTTIADSFPMNVTDSLTTLLGNSTTVGGVQTSPTPTRAAAFTDAEIISSAWAEKLVSASLVALLGAFNIAGVRCVVNLQMVLLVLLILGGCDWMVGTVLSSNSDQGILGFSSDNFRNNSWPESSGTKDPVSWLSALGVIFPGFTGIMSGVNMSGDLKDPAADIPRGTIAALLSSTVIYLLTIFTLGSTCARWALVANSMILKTMSATGYVFLAAVITSSVSSCLIALYGTSRVLQSMAKEGIISILSILGRGEGPNKVPVIALGALTGVTLVLVLAGQINTLAPIVSMPYLLCYASIDYAYFALAKSFDLQKTREKRFLPDDSQPVFTVVPKGRYYGSTTETTTNYSEEKGKKTGSPGMVVVAQSPETCDLAHSSERTSPRESAANSPHSSKDTAEEGDSRTSSPSKKEYTFVTTCGSHLIKEKPNSSWYSCLTHPWISLMGAISKVLLMFLIDWRFACVALGITLLLRCYIGSTNPSAPHGVAANFSFLVWINSTLKDRVLRRKGPLDVSCVIIPPTSPGGTVTSTVLNEISRDFSGRSQFHHAEVMKYGILPDEG